MTGMINARVMMHDDTAIDVHGIHTHANISTCVIRRRGCHGRVSGRAAGACEVELVVLLRLPIEIEGNRAHVTRHVAMDHRFGAGPFAFAFEFEFLSFDRLADDPDGRI